MADNVEYEFRVSRAPSSDNWEFFALRRVYADAGPDAVGDLLRTECFDGTEWTVARVVPARIIRPEEDRRAVVRKETARALRAGGEK